MPSIFLTKSAFKIGRSCPTKLFYHRAGYPSTKEENEYLQFLAEGGHIVGKLAQLLFPGGVLIDSSTGLEAAVNRTEEELKKENVILFEAALRAGNKLVLVDILEKTGSLVKLIEVKSKAFDSDVEREHKDKGKRTTFINSRKEIESVWGEYLEDICYQEYVARLSRPEFKFIPHLLLPDKAKTTSIEGLASMFSVEEETVDGSTIKHPRVVFSGDAEKVRKDHFLTLINVEEEVSLLKAEVESAAKQFEKSLSPLSKIVTPIGRQCSGCEYNTPAKEKNGFLECWGALGKVSPNIFDLYHGGTIKKGELFDALIRTGRISLFNVPLDALSGKRGERQSVQIKYSKENKEWVSEGLKAVVKGIKYPLYFVDFETSRVAVPYHAGMRPYEQVAFQWSCHKILRPGGAPEHSEWINTKELFPNFEFAKSLKEVIGDEGTVLTWASHERSTLNDIADQMERYGKEEPELRKWIEELTDEESGRILDLNKACIDYYFHPEMKGKTSLKFVLPAIWNNNKWLHDVPWLKKHAQYDEAGKAIDPYKVLSQIEIAGISEVVQEGTGAMRAYEDMMYGKVRDDPETTEKWRKLLLQYCELDTLAMVAVWVYWDRLVGIKSWIN